MTSATAHIVIFIDDACLGNPGWSDGDVELRRGGRARPVHDAEKRTTNICRRHSKDRQHHGALRGDVDRELWMDAARGPPNGLRAESRVAGVRPVKPPVHNQGLWLLLGIKLLAAGSPDTPDTPETPDTG